MSWGLQYIEITPGTMYIVKLKTFTKGKKIFAKKMATLYLQVFFTTATVSSSSVGPFSFLLSIGNTLLLAFSYFSFIFCLSLSMITCKRMHTKVLKKIPAVTKSTDFTALVGRQSEIARILVGAILSTKD